MSCFLYEFNHIYNYYDVLLQNQSVDVMCLISKTYCKAYYSYLLNSLLKQMLFDYVLMLVVGIWTVFLQLVS